MRRDDHGLRYTFEPLHIQGDPWAIRGRDRGSCAILRGRWFLRRVNPDRVRQDGWLGRLPHEALRVCGVGGHEHLLPGVTHRVGPPVVYDGWRHQPDARVAMLAVVPGEEHLTEDAGVLEAAEAFWEVRAILQCLELGLGERVIVAGIGPTVGFRDPQVGE